MYPTSQKDPAQPRPDRPRIATVASRPAVLSFVRHSTLAQCVHKTVRAGLLLNAVYHMRMKTLLVGLLLVGTSAFRARLFGRLRALPLGVASLWPASIGLLLLWDRSGLVLLRTELIIGALPFLGAALLGLVMLTYYRPGSGSIGPGEAD
jgi:hypothetical protein